MDDELAELVDTAPRSTFGSTLWRMHSVEHEALSGVGASLRGGRLNEPGTNTVYLAEPRGTAVIEVIAGLTLAKVPVRPTKYLVQRVEASFDEVIDLRDEAVVRHLGLPTEIVSRSTAPSVLARIGSASAYLGVDAVLFPSARSEGGTNVAAYVDNCMTCLVPTGEATPLADIIDDIEP